MLRFVYASIMSKVIPDIMEIHGNTDDHVVKTFHTESTTSEREAVTVVGKTLVIIRSWMSEKYLKMNDSKTEFIIYSSR